MLFLHGYFTIILDDSLFDKVVDRMVSIQSTVGTLHSFYANRGFLLGKGEKRLAGNSK